jgi:phosphoribosyl 1,2-cyclic phosphodiesterase
MRICVLGSGSKGNATYIESGETAVLIDCGFSGKETAKRLAAIGVPMERLTALLVTHEHTDHIKGIGVLSRRWNLPVFANHDTVTAGGETLARLHSLQEIDPGAAFVIKDLRVHPFVISHDAANPMGFVVRNKHWSVGYCTDTGAVTKVMGHRLAGCDCLILESNHDPELLRNGPYPLYLQQRIRSKTGHLDNQTAADFLGELAHDGLRHVCLAHLSEANNRPEIALRLANQVFCDQSAFRHTPNITAAPQDWHSECIVLRD